MRTVDNEVCITDVKSTKHLNKCQVLSIPKKEADHGLQHILLNRNTLTTGGVLDVMMTEALHPAAPPAKSPLFVKAKQMELEGLNRSGVFQIICKEEVSGNTNILGERFVLTIENAHTKGELHKERFEVQATPMQKRL